jgi:hypothetical protein
MTLQCPFCIGDMDERALVCPTCNRDVAIPDKLRAEHEELLHKRDRLRADLAAARTALASRKQGLRRSVANRASGE